MQSIPVSTSVNSVTPLSPDLRSDNRRPDGSEQIYHSFTSPARRRRRSLFPFKCPCVFICSLLMVTSSSLRRKTNAHVAAVVSDLARPQLHRRRHRLHLSIRYLSHSCVHILAATPWQLFDSCHNWRSWCRVSHRSSTPHTFLPHASNYHILMGSSSTSSGTHKHTHTENFCGASCSFRVGRKIAWKTTASTTLGKTCEIVFHTSSHDDAFDVVQNKQDAIKRSPWRSEGVLIRDGTTPLSGVFFLQDSQDRVGSPRCSASWGEGTKRIKLSFRNLLGKYSIRETFLPPRSSGSLTSDVQGFPPGVVELVGKFRQKRWFCLIKSVFQFEPYFFYRTANFTQIQLKPFKELRKAWFFWFLKNWQIDRTLTALYLPNIHDSHLPSQELSLHLPATYIPSKISKFLRFSEWYLNLEVRISEAWSNSKLQLKSVIEEIFYWKFHLHNSLNSKPKNVNHSPLIVPLIPMYD